LALVFTKISATDISVAHPNGNARDDVNTGAILNLSHLDVRGREIVLPFRGPMHPQVRLPLANAGKDRQLSSVAEGRRLVSRVGRSGYRLLRANSKQWS
jgi:hypothetical protein